MSDHHGAVGEDAGLEDLLQYLREARLFDFTSYKRGTLSRRVEKRMQQLGVESHEAYADYLEVHPDEFEELFNTILINVTSFFRDPEVWSILEETVLPELLERRGDQPVRIWSAGCASGQEPYSVVMLLAERLGVEGLRGRIKIYATDLDESALEQARTATYTAREVEGVPPDLLAKYFQVTPSGYVLNPELRRSVIVGCHDLLQDAPISWTDLLICRNTLMYFNADAQSQLVNRLHFSVADDGYLLLGKVEMLAQSDLFQAIDSRHRLFRRVRGTSVRSRLLAMAGGSGSRHAVGGEDTVGESAFECRTSPEILLDATGTVLAINARARAIFGLGSDVIGRRFHDLELSYRPIELRSRIDQARASGRVVELDEISRWTPDGDLTYLDIKLVPLQVDGEHLGLLVSFMDVSRHRRLQEELEQTHRELEVAYEELQSANEELETANEELQSTIEELETTNEELQSTNEELETMNEELSSANEELEAINDELRDRTAEVNQVNAYIESVLVSLHASVIVVDRDLEVRVWNGLSYEMWGLRAEEVEGRPLLGLNIGFPVQVLAGPLSACLSSTGPAADFLVEATSRRGQHLDCQVRIRPLFSSGRAIEGAIILISGETPEI